MRRAVARGMGRIVGVVAVWMGLGWGSAAAAPGQMVAQALSPQARQLALWARSSGDPKGRPFAIVDKSQAQLLVFDRLGRLAGASPALLGSTRGDYSVSGVGARAQAGKVGLHERTTPAGRFEARPGRNLSGELVVWADYASAFAIHRLRPGRELTTRRARLESATPEDNRVSLGCVVVPESFYERVVQPVLGSQRSVVYVLPETGPMQQVLRDL